VLQKIGYSIFFVLYKLFVCIEIRGRENLKNLQGPIILASNHTNELDVTAIPLILPFFSDIFPIYFVSNSKEKFRTFGWRSYIYGGTFFNMLGGYSIYSGNHDYAKSLENHIALLKKGRTLCIFPEGKRTRDNHMNPARGGLGYLVYSTNATVVPIAIDTFFNMSVRDFFTRQRKVIITVLKPMLPLELIPTLQSAVPTVDDFRNAGQKVLDKIKETLS
jgi:1-acyl-sn-glycerol-3-phosphate acyltransferase